MSEWMISLTGAMLLISACVLIGIAAAETVTRLEVWWDNRTWWREKR